MAAFTYWLYKNSLYAFWRFDDGAHLLFATTYSPSQYFFDPEITRQQSLFLTPWNVFFYKINLWLFGFNPEGFYFHQIILLWLASFGTFLLLSLWISSVGWRIFGSVLFLVGAPTSHIANELMTGHYATGLVFTVSALYLYMRSLREQRLDFAIFGALLYLLATSCKEVYVPVAGILLFLPEGSLSVRLKYSAPFGIAALSYVFWRFTVLGTLLSGYDPNGGYDFHLVWASFIHFPILLFGESNLGKVVIILILLLISYETYREELNWNLVSAAIVLLLSPLIPLMFSPGIREPGRYLFFIWWSISVFVTFLCSRAWESGKGKKTLLLIGLLLISASFKNSREETVKVLDAANLLEKSYSFLLSSNSRQIFLVPDFDPNLIPYFNLVLSGMVFAEKKLNPTSPVRAEIISDVGYFENLSPKDFSIWRYDSSCRCIAEVTDQVQRDISEYRQRLAEKPLSINLSLRGAIISWKFGPYSHGVYEVILDNIGTYRLPIKGEHSYASEKPLDGYIRYESPEGWVTRSPKFHLDSTHNPSWIWSR